MATPRKPEKSPARRPPAIVFDVWGCRGSRSLVPGLSQIGSFTSCYSLFDGETMVVVDAGRGLARMASAVGREARFRGLRKVRIFVTHAHMDHWEGLKDADWFWEKNNGLDVALHGPAEALEAIDRAHRHPSYVPLDRLAIGTLGAWATSVVEFRTPLRAGRWQVEAWPLNHYSGGGESKNFLQTAGWRIEHDDGPSIAYLSDHEPTGATAARETEMMGGSQLAVWDASYAEIRDHAYGHGSQEHAAKVARSHPGLLVLAAHHGPFSTDRLLRETFRKHGKGLPNYRLAVEGERWSWDRRTRAFVVATRRG